MNEKNIILKKKNYEYFLNNKLINLTQTEFDILLILNSNSKNYYSSCYISNLLNNKNYTSSTVRVHIKNIRNKFIQLTNFELILTIPKKGYKLNFLSIIIIN